MMPEDVKFGKIALELGFINQKQLYQSVQIQQQQKRPLAEIMVRLQFLTSFQVTAILNKIAQGQISSQQTIVATDIDDMQSVALPNASSQQIIFEENIAPTQNIGRYQILEEIGAGGMGKVYRVLDPNLDREVALKIILHQSQKSIQRFLIEAKATAKLQHPNIVTIYDMGEEQGKFFLLWT